MRKWVIALIISIILSLVGSALPGFITGTIAVIITVVVIPILIFILAVKAIKKFINYKREQLQVQKDILTELRKEKAE